MERQRAEGQFFSGEGLLKRLEHHIGKLDLIFLDMEMGELAVPINNAMIIDNTGAASFSNRFIFICAASHI